MSSKLLTKIKTEFDATGLDAMTNKSKKWFWNRIKTINYINEVTFLKDPNFIAKTNYLPGYMYHFIYDPKHSETLPYYDTFPLIIAVEKAKGGFYGLNLHYLRPMIRAQFLDKLLDFATNDKFDETTRLKMSYSLLKNVARYKEFAPCFKHYLKSQLKSRLMLVPASEWEAAVFLPTERFQKKTKEGVWRQSRKFYL